MEKHYELFVGIDISKGKADAAILQVSNLRSVKPKFLRKKLSFKFTKSDVSSFLSAVRSKYDDNCTHVTFGLEVTGIYSNNVYNFIKSQLNDLEEIRFLNTEFVNKWRKAHNIAKSDPLDAQTISNIIGTDPDVRYVNHVAFDNEKGYQDLKALIHCYYQLKKLILKKLIVSFPRAMFTFPNFSMFLNLNPLLF